MENVKGMLSSTVESRLVFEMLMEDLSSLGTGRGQHYEIFAIQIRNGKAVLQEPDQPADFIVRAETLGISSGSAQDIFYEALDECEDKFNMSIREFIFDFVKLECTNDRLNRILNKQENIKFDELSDWLLEIEGTIFNGINSYWFVPIINFDQDQPWMIVEQTGAPLDPEYSLVAVFTSKSDADHYFNENYDFQIKLS